VEKALIVLFFTLLLLPAGCVEENAVDVSADDTRPLMEGVSCPGCNLILISVDTLRADHLGFWGYSRDTSPSIDRFAGGNIVFMNAYSQAPSTLPSHASIFTSLYPSVHRAEISTKTRLDDGLTTMAEVLHTSGYSTASYNGGGHLVRGWRVNQGFQTYHSEPSSFNRQFNYSINWLKNHSGGPFFLFIHSYDVHAPYYYPSRFYRTFNEGYDMTLEEFKQQDFEVLVKCVNGTHPDRVYCLEQEADNQAYDVVYQVTMAKKYRSVNRCPCSVDKVTALYDDGIRYVDDSLKVFLTNLEAMGLLENTVIVFTSDHGEELGEHGRLAKHSFTLYDELIHVPLIIHIPNGSPMKVMERVESIDIMPTILSVLKVPYGGPMQGTDHTRHRPDELVFAEFDYGYGRGQALIKDDLKVILMGTENWSRYEWMVFNTSQDRGDRNDISDLNKNQRLESNLSRPLLEQSMANDRLRHELNVKGRKAVLDDEMVNQLRALGYAT
jgi:arylsulfatase A-like enzyme